MANSQHVLLLEQGISAWNKWRDDNPEVEADLSGEDLSKRPLTKFNFNGTNLQRTNLYRANLSKTNLSKANLRGAELSRANLSEADLSQADLSQASLIEADLSQSILTEANLSKANFIKADLSEADLSKANLYQANLYQTNLYQADLAKASLVEVGLGQANLSKANFYGAQLINSDLSGAQLVEANFERTQFVGCYVYAISAWNLRLTEAIQSELTITRPDEPRITVDNLEVAQFIYLLVNNVKIRSAIDTITSKVVLILGRFTEERLGILRAVRTELRNYDYLPVLFDFEGPSSKDTTETISTLARLARFIVADITDAKAIPQELSHIVPDLPSVLVKPIIQASDREYGMFKHFKRYPWVLETYHYDDMEELISSFSEKVIAPIELEIEKLKLDSKI